MRYMAKEIGRGIFKSKLFWLSGILLYMLMVVNLMDRSSRFDLSEVGTLNAFMIIFIHGRYTDLLFPVLAVIPYSFALCDDIHSGYIKPIMIKRSFREYFSVKAVTAFLASFLLFIIIFTAFFVMLFLLYPKASIRMNQVVGAFRFIYDRSMLLYCVIFIVHNALFAGSLSLLGTSIAGYTGNRYFGIIIPIALCFVSMFIGRILIIDEWSRVLYKIIPTFLFKFENKALSEIVYDFVIINVTSIVIMYLTYRRWYESVPTNE